jgi:N-acetylneuraminic acid mutarotase
MVLTMKDKAVAVMVVLLFLSAAFLIEILVSGEAVAGDSWSQVASLPVKPSDGLVASVVGGKIYVFGSNFGACYDPQTNNWTAIATPSGSFESSVEYQNKVYLMGTTTTQVYDPSTGNYTIKASAPEPSPEPLETNPITGPGTFFGYQAVAVDGKIYQIGGATIGQAYGYLYDETYVYDTATDYWSTMTPIPVAVFGYAAAAINDKIYIIGGGTDQNADSATTLVQIFDPSTNKWTNGPSIPSGVIDAGSCTTTGLLAPQRIYIIGGSTAYDWGWLSANSYAVTKTNLNQVYDPATETWSSASPLPYANVGPSFVNVGDTLYMVGGTPGNGIARVTVEKYTPAGYSPPTPSPTTQPTATPTSINTSPPTNSTLIPVAIVAVLVLAGVTSYLVLLRRHRKTASKLKA